MQFPKIKNLKVHQIQSNAQIITGNGLKILQIDGEYLPFLSEITILEKFPNIAVDAGAIKFVCKGANVMRPGVVKFSEFKKDQLVVVVETSHNKFLAVGKTTVSSSEMENMKNGLVLKNIHYISDKFWELGKSVHD